MGEERIGPATIEGRLAALEARVNMIEFRLDALEKGVKRVSKTFHPRAKIS